MNRKFNVRVYGICIHNGNVLVADELIKGREITKFPGGGLEFGEGTLDCIKREFKEEAGQEIEVIRHFYTTDFFVESAFNPESQVISIYYLVKFISELSFAVKNKKFDFIQRTNDVPITTGIVFRWIPLKEISEKEFTFVIDKKVAEMIKTEFA